MKIDKKTVTLSQEMKNQSLKKNVTWKKALIQEASTLEEAIKRIDAAALQILMVVDEQNKLIGTITDGDIRRGLLREVKLCDPIKKIMHGEALVVPEGLESEIILKVMAANSIKQIPIVNEKREVIGLHIWDRLVDGSSLENPMVVMAGGMGKRLHPYTKDCPKPLLSVYGKPILEHILRRAISDGFSQFYFSVNYLGDMIKNYFKNGEEWGVKISYITEDKPLGTAGALKNLENKIDTPFVVTNGDVLTHMKYSDLLEFHQKQNASATMAVRTFEQQNPFGVITLDGVMITGIEEKPVQTTQVNTGVYAFDSTIFDFLKKNEIEDMPNLFLKIRNSGERTVAYPMHEPWLDVGRPEDYKIAAEYIK